jgi:hypothetical protein
LHHVTLPTPKFSNVAGFPFLVHDTSCRRIAVFSLPCSCPVVPGSKMDINVVKEREISSLCYYKF